jgi:CheY-like chemotaxis protein
LHPGTPTHSSPLSAAVMIVDDVFDNREMYGTFLSQAGLRVALAATAEEAWEKIQREPPQVVVTDLAMPGLDGFELCRKIRALRSPDETAIITLTGLTLKSADLERLIDAGSDRLLLKPCLPTSLLEEIRKACAQSAALRLESNHLCHQARILAEKHLRLQEWSADLPRQLQDWRRT